jgi:hypothetical protein
MNPRCSPQGVRRRHLSDEDANLPTDRWTAVRAGIRTSGPSAAEPVAMPPHDGVRLHEHHRRAPVGPESGQADPKPVGRAFGGAGAWSCVSSRSAAGVALGSPRPIPDGRGASTPARGRARGAAPACVDRGWRRRENQQGRVLARVTHTGARYSDRRIAIPQPDALKQV